MYVIVFTDAPKNLVCENCNAVGSVVALNAFVQFCDTGIHELTTHCICELCGDRQDYTIKIPGMDIFPPEVQTVHLN